MVNGIFQKGLNPIQDGGVGGGGLPKRPPYQFFSCKFYERRD